MNKYCAGDMLPLDSLPESTCGLDREVLDLFTKMFIWAGDWGKWDQVCMWD